ncbi:hypothetical protein EGW08_013965 [Elysia chlorotica]|uniref:FH2 domain-containing protein n=1 Tax=Elysia chlorotica TaxID=188477 RepID=A0A433T9Y9_ELYCH|nr:hypothetical protein EGW08_013965 [Elysia chlorotica]
MERRQPLMLTSRSEPRPRVPLTSPDFQMDKKKGSPSRKRNIFKGSVLVSLLVESHPEKFPTRVAASRLARSLYKDGHIRSIFGASEFEDSAHLYVWNDNDDLQRRTDGGHLGRTMPAPVTSSISTPALPSSRSEAKAFDQKQGDPDLDWQLIQDIKSKVLNRSETYNIVTSYNTFFQELERDFGVDHNKVQALGGGRVGRSDSTPYTSTLELKKQSSAHKSVDTPTTVPGQAQKDSIPKTVGEAAKRDIKSAQPSQKTYNRKKWEVSNSREPVISSPVAQKHLSSKHNIIVSTGSTVKDSRASKVESSKAIAHPLKESNSVSNSALPEPQHTGDHFLSPSKASSFSPSSALVKSHQNHKYQKYHHHEFQNLTNINPAISQSATAKASFQAHKRSEPRDYRKFEAMDSNVTANIFNQKTYAKNFDSASPESHKQHHSQPSTLESGIGSSHPDSTANSSSVPPNHQSFSLGTAETSDYHHHQYNQTQPYGHQRYTKDSNVSPQEYQHHGHHQSHSLSPPEIPKYPDAMSPRRDREEHYAFNKDASPSRSKRHDPSSGGKSIGHKNIGIIEGAKGFEDPDVADPIASSTRFHKDIGGNDMQDTNLVSGSGEVVGGIENARRWASEAGVVIDSNNSYSDNEKQLLEEMRRMKQEHQSVLRTYEGRVNKLMAKMHELRNIAEMLENSSSKPLPGKLLDILEDKDMSESRLPPAVSDSGAVLSTPAIMGAPGNVDSQNSQGSVPPPLPPRPSRGTRVYPNKPIIHTSAQMQPLLWTRIILDDDGVETPVSTVWHGMKEPLLDTEELERLFSGGPDQSSDVNLYEDICLRRGRAKTQLVSIYESERSQRIMSELKALPCTLPDVIQAFVTLNSNDLHTDSFAELLELLTSARELDKILHHVKRKGAGQLDAPEYLVYELSKVDHFRERLEFLRFKNKLQINLFEIDQQLKELNTACEEIMTNLSLKNVLETVLAVGNHMNAGTDQGQADGFRVEVLNSLKDIQDTLKRGNLLELILRVYCLKYESDVDVSCPTRFQLPEPSNMRHAAQVSFEDIQRALKELKEELSYVREKLEALSVKEGNTVTIALRVTSENFMTSAMEVLVEEQKLLETTRIRFWKTASYFSQDGQKSSPREFFQVWASFLHDCKYYWKLAHRNLARDKFNADLATTSQLSSSSLPGFNSLKSTMMRHVASFSQDEEMRENRARQLEHINSWIESVGRYTLEMGPEDHEENFLNETDFRHQQQSYPHHLQQHEQHNNHPHHLPQNKDFAGDAFDSPENADDRDCLTPVNLPDINPLDDRQVKGGDSQWHADQGNFEDDLYPYYKNQPRMVRSSKTSSKWEIQQPKGQHQQPGFSQAHKIHQISVETGFNLNQMQTSPKPIKAIPPNVIKPQPITQASPTVSSPSPTSPHHHTIHLAKPMPRVDTNNNTHSHNDAKKNNSNTQTSVYGSTKRANHTGHLNYNGNFERDNYTEGSNFGFEPLYESLSRHAFNQPASPPSDGSETPPPYTESESDQVRGMPQTESQDYNDNSNTLSPGSTEPENSHKKNGNFFKSLIKRDSKQRTPASPGDQQHQNSNQQSGNQHSALRSVSAPFNKLRNTVVQKLSGSSNSKKSNGDNEKSPSAYVTNGSSSGNNKDVRENPDGLEESPPKPPRGFLIDQNHESQAEVKIVNNGINPFHDDVVNYQNYFYPGQPRRADVAPDKQNHKESEFEKYQSSGRPATVMLVGSGHRDGHDSLPSTVSSRHSGKDQGLSMYKESNSHGFSNPHSKSKERARRPDHSRERHTKPSHPYGSPDNYQNRTERHAHRSGPKRRSGRDRAPIALGSNVSISDMYGKALEAATQFSEDEEAGGIRNSENGREDHMCEVQPNTHYQQEEHALVGKRDVETSNSISMTAESKWVKATAVPVYKAKLIPNYENQSKYDPKLEGGIRGHAGPVTSPASGSHAGHAPQGSSSSDMYRQELQKKSGQYVAGIIYQDPSNCSSLKSRNENNSAIISSPASSVYPGAPTSYTVLPPKFSSNHYHASPLVFSQHPTNSSELHQSSNQGKSFSENKTNDRTQRATSPSASYHHNQYQASAGDGANTDSNHLKTVAASMFTVSPDGRLELGPSRDAHSAEGGLCASQKEQQGNRRVVARRSSSANNILDRAQSVSKTPSDGQGKRRYHVDDNVYNARHNQGSHDANNEISLQGHVSRRDDAKKKVTPTSSRQPAAPQSVMNLVDRFEQTPPPKLPPTSNFLQAPFMEDDKPPSMTSTPLARRKNIREEGTMVSPPVSSGRSDDASTHSHSTGSKRSYSRHHGEHHNQQSRHFVKSSDNTDKTKSHKYDKNEDHHSHKRYDGGHKSNTKRSGSYPEVSHHHFQESPNSLPSSQQQNQQEPGSSAHQNRRHHQNQRPDKTSHDGTQKSAQTQQSESILVHGNVLRDSGKEIRASSQIASSTQYHGWSGHGRRDERLTYSSQSHRHGHFNSPPISASHIAGTVYHSPFLPKPEPQYPGQQKHQQQSKASEISGSKNSQNNDSRHHHSSDRNIQLRNPHQMSQSPSSNNINKTNINNNININNVGGKSNSHSVHRRPSPQILYISPVAGQQAPSNNSNGDDNIATPMAINNKENAVSTIQPESSGNDVYTAELRRAIKSSNSAFDRPLKSGPLYGRQPGAMAVVKPTVMHP